MDNNIISQGGIKTLPPIVPVSKWEAIVGDRSTASLRWDIFVNRNGFNDRCIVRRGRRLLINVAEYFKWLAEQGSIKPPAN